MSIFHTIANTPGFTVMAVNHFVAAVKDDEIVAVFNTKSRTVQVTDWTAAAVIDPTFENLESDLLGFRRVNIYASNDARPMFN